MRWMVLAFAGWVVFQLEAQTSWRFRGSVSSGEHFEKPIGQGLTFELVPDDGWTIRVAGGADMARCVMLPLHGPSVLQIAAWKFGKGGERVGDHAHDFDFTLSAADQERACAEMDVVAETAGRPRRDPDTGILTIGTPGYRAPRLGHGQLVVTKIQMSPGVDGKPDVIQKMDFVVWCSTRPNK